MKNSLTISVEDFYNQEEKNLKEFYSKKRYFKVDNINTHIIYKPNTKLWILYIEDRLDAYYFEKKDLSPKETIEKIVIFTTILNNHYDSFKKWKELKKITNN